MRRGRFPWTLAALLAGALVLTACADDPADGAAEGAVGGHPVGVLRLGLEDTETLFIEGFQLQLGVDTAADGEERTYAWEQLVMDEALEWPPGVTEQDLEWWYAGELVMELPAGEITVTSHLQVGMDEPGDPCSTTVDLGAGATREVRVLLTGPERGCPVPGPPA